MDVFDSNAFTTKSLTDAIEAVPHQPRRIGRLGLFKEEGIPTTSIMVEQKAGLLTMIPASPRGGVGDTIGEQKRTARAFNCHHLERESVILADSIQNLREFGSENNLAAIESVVNRRLETLRAMHEVTLEYHRIGAIKGVILDADGATTLYNLFTEFGVAQQTLGMALTTTTTDVRAKCVAAIRLSEAELGGVEFSGMRAFCGAGFFDALVGHTLVQESLKYQESAMLRVDLRNGFQFGGITWEEYRGSVGGVSFVGDTDAYLFPEGPNNTPLVLPNGSYLFSTYFAPADFEEAVNTIGRPIYAKQAPDPRGLNRSRLIHTQSNPLSLCLVPRAVIKLTKV
jgi:hypothetical protein